MRGKSVRSHLFVAGLLLCLVPGSAAQQEPSSAPELSKPPTADFSHARKLMDAGKIDDAITELQAIEASNPATKGLALELGVAYYKKSDFPKAIEQLKRASA